MILSKMALRDHKESQKRALEIPEMFPKLQNHFDLHSGLALGVLWKKITTGKESPELLKELSEPLAPLNQEKMSTDEGELDKEIEIYKEELEKVEESLKCFNKGSYDSKGSNEPPREIRRDNEVGRAPTEDQSQEINREKPNDGSPPKEKESIENFEVDPLPSKKVIVNRD